MASNRPLDPTTQARTSDIVCESEDIRQQCDNCKSPLFTVQESSGAMRHATLPIMYCKQCNLYYIEWNDYNE